MMYRFIYIILALMIWQLNLCGQNLYAVRTTGIYESSPEKIKLRWAPQSLETWEHGKTHGYRLVRYTYFNGTDTLTGSTYTNSMVIIDSMLIHLPENNWSQVQESDTNIVGFAQAALFDDEAEIEMIGVSEYVQARNIQEADESRYNFGLVAADRSFEVAKAMGLGFEDSNIQSGFIYDYVVLVNNIPGSAIIGGAKSRLKAQSDSSGLPIPQPSWGMGRDRKVLVNWSIPQESDIYLGYFLERSDNMGGSYSSVNDLPVTGIATEEGDESTYSLLDSVPNNFQTYVYRIRGIDIWQRLSDWSDTIHIYCLPSPVETAPFIDSLKEQDAGGQVQIQVSWKFPDSLEHRIDGFHILRSVSPRKEYTSVSGLLSKQSRSWTDVSPTSVGYYKIKIIDDTGSEVTSYEKFIQLQDTIPPGPPKSLVGSCDENGNITVSWTAPSDDDVSGYKVYTTYNEQGILVERTTEPVNDTFFIFNEDLNIKNKYVFVYVQAIDHHSNYSDMEMNKIKLYDIVPPSPPQLLHTGQHPYGFILEIKASPDPDAVLYKIERRLGSDNAWEVIHTFSDWVTDGMFTAIDTQNATYIDTTVLQAMPYAYRITAEDDTGNAAASRVSHILPHKVGKRPEVTNMNISTFTSGNGKFMRIGWNYSDTDDFESFQVLRQVDQYPMLGLTTTEGSLQEAQEDWPGVTIPGGQGNYLFVDLLLDQNNNLYETGDLVTKVRYRVIARHYDGTTSPLSEIIELTF